MLVPFFLGKRYLLFRKRRLSKLVAGGQSVQSGQLFRLKPER